MTVGPMVPLTSVANAFAAKVLAARLGSEGIVWELRGNVDGPYPMGEVTVLVARTDLWPARELLLADEIDACFPDDADEDAAADVRRAPFALWMVLAGVLSLPVITLGRLALLL